MLTKSELRAAALEQALFNDLFLQALSLELVEDGDQIELEDLKELLNAFWADHLD